MGRLLLCQLNPCSVPLPTCPATGSLMSAHCALMFSSPGLSPLKSMTNTHMMGRRKHLLARTGALTGTSWWLAMIEYSSILHLIEHTSTTALCAYAQSVALHNWIIVDSSFSIWRPRALFIQTGVEPEIPLRPFSFARFERWFRLARWCQERYWQYWAHRNHLFTQYEGHYGESLLNSSRTRGSPASARAMGEVEAGSWILSDVRNVSALRVKRVELMYINEARH